jgi:hypothetical protein
VGKYDGGIDFLVACGFRRVLLLGTASKSTTTTPSVEQLKLRQEDEDPIHLFTGRCQLIIFAQNVLQLSSSQWPDCPYKVIKCTTQPQTPQEKTTDSVSEDAGGGGTECNDGDVQPSSPRSVKEDENKILMMLEYSSKAEMMQQHPHSQHPASVSTPPAATTTSPSSSSTTTTTPSREKGIPPPHCTTTHQSSLHTVVPNNISIATNSALEYYNSLQLLSTIEKKVDDDTTNNDVISDNLLNEIENELNGSNNNDEGSFFLDYNEASQGNSSLDDRGMIIDAVGAAVTTPATTTKIDVNNYEYDSNIDERIMGVRHEHETIVHSSSSSNTNNSSVIRLEQSKRQGSVIDEDDKHETGTAHRDKMNNIMMMTDSEHTYQSASNNTSQIDITSSSTKDGEQSPLQLSEMVEIILDLTEDGVDSNQLSSSYHVGSAKRCNNALVDDEPLSSSYKSASDMLSDLELDSEFNHHATEFNVQQQQQQQQQQAKDQNIAHDKSSIHIVHDHNQQDEREDIPNNDHYHHIHPNNISDSSLLVTPPLDDDLEKSNSHHMLYTQFFNDIPLPEGEFSSSSTTTNCDDDSEDVRKYRTGFVLCHQLLFSLWWSTDLYWDKGGSQSSISNNSSTRTYVPVPSSFTTIDPTIGLTDLKRHRQIWEDEIKEGIDSEKPLMLIPLDIVYASWAWFLRLNEGGNNDSEEGDVAVVETAAATSGKMYLWIMSNHHHLSKIDDVSMTSTHPTLPETSVNVCNYVCKSLRDIGLISIYSAGIAAVGESSKLVEYFLGINHENLFLEGMPSKLEDIIPILLLNDVKVLSECHDVLSELVCPKLYNILDLANNTDNDVSTNSRWTCWYSCRYAVKHLLASSRLEEAKRILSDTRYIMLRLRNMGLLVGTAAHCHDCSAMALIVSQSPDRRNKRSDSIAGWSEEHYQILCSVSSILRKKAGDLSHDQNDSRRRTLQMDIGNVMLMIGKCIADIGIYRVQEVEHYEEALALKTESYGGDQNHESLADILVSIYLYHITSAFSLCSLTH